MKYRRILNLICIGFNLVWSLNLSSQHTIINYRGTAIFKSATDSEYSNNMTLLTKRINNSLKNIDIQVKTNGVLNIVSYVEKLENDFNGGTLKNLTLSMALNGKQIFTDYSRQTSYYESLSYNMLRSVSTSNIEWEILDDVKNILGYKCYKALGNIVSLDEEYRLAVPTIAWFCPELSLKGGPTAYATLPGLILELENKKMKFTAISIEENKNTLREVNLKNKKIKSHKEFVAYFSANNPLSRLNNKK
ncbi:GLPGLI family protein [Dokdonia sp. R86516]|uniref:GLPGLI family protein n=1 Tax=Dokdonia sp. R86516 TaxID=3093856 RepID=UPI0037CB1F8D